MNTIEMAEDTPEQRAAMWRRARWTNPHTLSRIVPFQIFKIACSSAILIFNLLEYVMHVLIFFS